MLLHINNDLVLYSQFDFFIFYATILQSTFCFLERTSPCHTTWACIELLSTKLEIDFCCISYCYGPKNKYIQVQQIPSWSSYSVGEWCCVVSHHCITNSPTTQRQGMYNIFSIYRFIYINAHFCYGFAYFLIFTSFRSMYFRNTRTLHQTMDWIEVQSTRWWLLS